MQGASSDLSNSLCNSGQLSILYYNARSILPKLNNLAASCLALKPDIVCIVESWLCNDISDNEIALPYYSSVRSDRNRHGGGILLYIKDNLPYNVVFCGSPGLELVFISIFLQNNKCLYLGTFYRPPSSPISIFDTLFDVYTLFL